MNTLRILTLISFLILNTYSIKAQTYVSTTDVNIRSGTGTNYEKVGLIKRGDTVTIIEKSGSWGKINHNGVDGYIKTSKLSSTPAPSNKESDSSGSKTIGGIVLFIIVMFIWMKNTRFWRFLFPKLLGSPDAYSYKCNRCNERFYNKNSTAKCYMNKPHIYYRLR